MKIILKVILVVTIIVECKQKPVKEDETVKAVAITESPKYLSQENKKTERKHKHKDQEKYYYWDKDERWEKKQRKKKRDKNRYKDSDSDEGWDEKNKKYWKKHKKHRDKHWDSDDSEESREKKHRHKKHQDKDREISESLDSDETKEYDKKHRHKKHILELKGLLRQRFSYECMEAVNGMSSVCSPLSALKPIGMLAFGAEGAALDEILNAIGITHLSSVKSHFKDVLHDLALRTSGLHMASRIYIHNNKKLHSSFKHQAESVFGSCIEQLNLRDRGKTALEINNWITYHTNKKVAGILSPDDISSNTVAIIVDAIYFWGRWKHPFSHVKSETFHASHGARSASMMCNVRKYNYGKSKELDAQVIEIPFQERDMKLIVLLPANKNGLGALIRQLKLAPDLINNVKMSERKVQLQLPKFKIETSLNLNSLYQRVGLREMFNPQQGLTKVLSHEKVYVDKGVQRVFIVIDQEGAEAGGGYGSSFGGSHKEEKQVVVFHADHPFMFFVTLRKQQLFAGALQ